MENTPPIYYTPPFTTPIIYYPLVYPQFYYTYKINEGSRKLLPEVVVARKFDSSSIDGSSCRR